MEEAFNTKGLFPIFDTILGDVPRPERYDFQEVHNRRYSVCQMKRMVSTLK